MSRLLPHSLQARLLLIFLTLNLLGIGGIVAWNARAIENDTIEQAEHELEIQSHLIADALRIPYEAAQSGAPVPGGTLVSQVQSYAKKNAVNVTLIDAQLHAVVSSDPGEPPADFENKPEVQAAVNGIEQHDIRWDESHTGQRLYVAAAILNMQGVNEGYVQLAAPMAPIYADIRQPSRVPRIPVVGYAARCSSRASSNLAAASRVICVGSVTNLAQRPKRATPIARQCP